MNKFVLLFLLLALTTIGCYKPPERLESDTQKFKIEVESRQPVSPPVIVVPPVYPVSPSPSYLAGYNDGYYRQWLAPARWAVVAEYRAGWGAGKNDRDSGLPYRFPK